MRTCSGDALPLRRDGNSTWARAGAWLLLSTEISRVIVDPEDIDRPASEVFHDHLELRSAFDLETDLRRNYAPDVLVLTSYGAVRGHDGIRHTAATLRRHSRGGEYEYLHEVVHGDLAYLVWQVRMPREWIHGADSFRIEHGKIVLQTIHYVVIGDASAK
jgi:SnoaL-like domain